MKNRHIGVGIARRLRTTEHAVDNALIETTGLIQAMIEARREAGFAADVGQPALLHMVRGLTQLAEARGAVVDGHERLAAVAAAQEFGWRLDGPLEQKTKPVAVPAIGIAA